MSDPKVVQPAGPAMVDAAEWVGQSCWAELRWHQVLTAWLAAEPQAETMVLWWSLRADAAERAEAWHRRLPELAQMPRSGFVGPPTEATDDAYGQWEAATDSDRRDRAVDALAGLAERYREHVSVAVGPADAPVAQTLADALVAVQRSLTELRSP
ncbi:MAG: hypothetical protein ACR2MB_15460 [Acidimicrobiales bacterium]